MSFSERLIPHYIPNASQLMKQLVFDDTEVGYGLRATEKHIPSFEEKTVIIVEYSIYALNSTEKKYKKLIKEILPNEKIAEEKSISKKIRLLDNLDFITKQHYHHIQSSYIEIFNTLREIFLQYKIFLNNNTTKYGKSPITPIEDDLINSLYDPEITGNIEFRNRVLSLIFPLNIQIYEINKIINSPPGIPADPAVKKIRSAIGGTTRNYGEKILLGKILNFLSTKRPTDKDLKYASASELFKEHEDDLTDILENYQKLIGHPLKTGGPKISYGDSLKPIGLLRKILQWSKNDLEFAAELTQHIKKKSSDNPENS